jgi:hypothetical protein
LAAVGLWALVSAAPVGATPIVLPSPAALLMPPPPLLAGATPLETEHELRFPGHIRNTERVEVGLRSDGSASSVVVTQRLLIGKVGDYAFTVPAPVVSVEAAPGSESQPGQRNTGIIWQGFSPGRRLLAARASVDPLPAERGLPLSIRIERRGGSTVVRVIDIARRTLTITQGSASPASLALVLRGLRESVRAPNRVQLTRTLQVDGISRGTTSAVVTAPVRVQGSITAAGRRVPVSWVLGGGRPLVREVSLPGGAMPKLALEAELLRPLELIPGERGLTLERLQVALARIALSAQYDQYLASPDQLGLSRTSYAFRTAAEATPNVQSPRPQSGGDGDVLAIVLGSVLGAAALVGLVVLWAHS